MDKEVLTFDSQELQELFKEGSNFAKFDINVPKKVKIKSSEIIPREANFDGKITTRYDLSIEIEGEEKIWSVSKTVLKTIAESWEKTKLFNVMRQEKSYSVIPVLE